MTRGIPPKAILSREIAIALLLPALGCVVALVAKGAVGEPLPAARAVPNIQNAICTFLERGGAAGRVGGYCNVALPAGPKECPNRVAIRERLESAAPALGFGLKVPDNLRDPITFTRGASTLQLVVSEGDVHDCHPTISFVIESGNVPDGQALAGRVRDALSAPRAVTENDLQRWARRPLELNCGDQALDNYGHLRREAMSIRPNVLAVLDTLARQAGLRHYRDIEFNPDPASASISKRERAAIYVVDLERESGLWPIAGSCLTLPGRDIVKDSPLPTPVTVCDRRLFWTLAQFAGDTVPGEISHAEYVGLGHTLREKYFPRLLSGSHEDIAQTCAAGGSRLLSWLGITVFILAHEYHHLSQRLDGIPPAPVPQGLHCKPENEQLLAAKLELSADDFGFEMALFDMGDVAPFAPIGQTLIAQFSFVFLLEMSASEALHGSAAGRAANLLGAIESKARASGKSEQEVAAGIKLFNADLRLLRSIRCPCTDDDLIGRNRARARRLWDWMRMRGFEVTPVLHEHPLPGVGASAFTAWRHGVARMILAQADCHNDLGPEYDPKTTAVFLKRGRVVPVAGFMARLAPISSGDPMPVIRSVRDWEANSK